MKSIYKYLFASTILSLSLTACGQTQTPTSIATTSSAAPTTTTQSSTTTTTQGEQRNDELYEPGKAPTDYETKDVNDSALDLKEAFFTVQHKLLNTNFYSRVSGTTSGGSGKGITQNVTGFRIYNGSLGFTQAVTVSEPGGLANVNTGEQRVEDLGEKIFLNRTTKDKQCTVSQSDSNYMYGEVKENGWDQTIDLHDQTTFKAKIGHDIFGLTNYYLPNEKAISNIQKGVWADNHYVLQITFSTSDANGAVDATQGYSVEQQHMIQKSLSNASIRITSLMANLTFDNNWMPTNLDVTEKYDVNYVGLKLQLTSSFNTEFFTFTDVNSIDVPAYKASYTDALKAFDLNANSNQ